MAEPLGTIDSVVDSDEPGYVLVHVTTSTGRELVWQVPRESSPVSGEDRSYEALVEAGAPTYGGHLGTCDGLFGSPRCSCGKPS